MLLLLDSKRTLKINPVTKKGAGSTLPEKTRLPLNPSVIITRSPLNSVSKSSKTTSYPATGPELLTNWVQVRGVVTVAPRVFENTRLSRQGSGRGGATKCVDAGVGVGGGKPILLLDQKTVAGVDLHILTGRKPGWRVEAHLGVSGCQKSQ